MQIPKSSALKNIKLSLDLGPPTEETVGGLLRVYNCVYNCLIEIASGLVQEYIRAQDKVLSSFVKTVRSSSLKKPPYGFPRLSEPIIQA